VVTCEILKKTLKLVLAFVERQSKKNLQSLTMERLRLHT